MEYTAPKMNWKARVAVPAATLVCPDEAKIKAAMHIEAQVTQQARLENMSNGRRPILSTSVAPMSAKKSCWHTRYRE